MPTAYHGTEQEQRALNTLIKMLRAAESVSTFLQSGRVSAGLSISQFGVLETLYHLGPMCQRDLGRKILKSSGNITTVIDNLEKRQLVERRRLETDRRYFQVHLTEKGRTLIAQVFPEHVERIVERFSVLSADEQEQLAMLCKKFGMASTEKDPEP
ncbi:MarR family winged helix-turn-helix transcriptional regulator [Desulfuromonas acetoxidans]|uniref:Transcriptional regulator, MarR family n=1 Tax=Desulfuromonas acetoxidans (strain DSM 684 / 11070) TaxID=281689 RepID=Q1K2C1_DESA6|nr:MarR family transcriptional regulator [Desulfuromonas acetoxidans]EAT16518.1 transcriptional regulator, MarR family [Desulfuromonas acetoxidans DSM 684]MBF0646756.1 MarR family transcriptional regulator [Desulfuromonas acetoxidans]NVD26134.1 MarR family transcriptional regulator [Desulfuromonas acetoxidans]NVE17967.1 MarR family transcriptional regulator [Desulfuromonas acetoxidans]